MKSRNIIGTLGIGIALLLSVSNALADENVTDLVKIKKSHPHFDKKTQTTTLDVRVQNKSRETLTGYFMVVVEEMDNPDVSVENPDGFTQGMKPFFIYKENKLRKNKKTPKREWIFKGECDKKLDFQFETADKYKEKTKKHKRGKDKDKNKKKCEKKVTVYVSVYSEHDGYNHPPIADAGKDQDVLVGEAVSLDGRESHDPEDALLTYHWKIFALPEASGAEIDNPESVTPAFIPDIPGDYVFELTVNDGMLDSEPDDVVVIAASANAAPTADAGADQNVITGTLVTLDGTGSFDPNMDPLAFRWETFSLPAGSFAYLDDPESSTPSFTPDLDGKYIFSLTVSDGELDSLPEDVVVFAATPNAPPVADAGQDQEVHTGETITLDASASYDPDKDPLSYSWSIVSQPNESVSTLDDPGSMSPTLLADRPGDFVIRLIVHDGELDSDPVTTVVSALTQVPDVTGLTGAEAQAALEAAGLVLGTTLQSYHQAVLAGRIFDQEPPPANWQKAAYPVDIWISLGPLTVTVPDVIGQTQADAEQAIAGAGLAVGTVTTHYSASIPAGEVLSQEPAAGESLIQGNVVNLVVSLGPLLATVPEVTGMHRDDAAAALNAAGLLYTAASFLHHDTIGKNHVIRQSPQADITMPSGSVVELTISLGPDLGLPPDPSVVSPPADPTQPTVFQRATRFLYTGDNPIQTGIDPAVIEPRRTAIIRGKVLTQTGAPLPGVRVSILHHPEYGRTLSREDGLFDLVVNGGGPMTVTYEKENFLPAQRKVEAPWQDWTWASDVAMVQLDPNVTEVDLTTGTMQVARGSVVSDERGSRQATLLFTPGTHAEMQLPDGTFAPLDQLHVRTTEYSTGENGKKAMPAALPPPVGYTYCVELSADEALAVGAKSVRFDQPVINYVDNFIGFPTGTLVPAYFYDRDQGLWVPLSDGRVIEIVGLNNDSADLDVTGDGQADDAAALASLGITEAERQRLAGLYSLGKTLWRVALTHFSPCDYNMRYDYPDSAYPATPEIGTDTSINDPCVASGNSTIECQNQVLGESIPVTGTPFRLHYSSNNNPGRKVSHTLKIPLSHGDYSYLLVEIWIAGDRIEQKIEEIPAGGIFTYEWGGKNAYGQVIQGDAPVQVRIGYAYPCRRCFADGVTGYISCMTIPGEYDVLWSGPWKGNLDHRDGRRTGLGGWSLSHHHQYVPHARALYTGDGRSYDSESLAYSTLRVVAGIGYDSRGDDIPATDARLGYLGGPAVGPDGTIFINDYHRIRTIGTDGIIRTIAGSWDRTCDDMRNPCGDGGPAIEASLGVGDGLPNNSVIVGPDESIHFIDNTGNPHQCGGSYQDNARIRKISPDGVISTVAGSGRCGAAGNGGPALEARFRGPRGIAFGPDGSLFVADTVNHQIRRIGTDGIITLYAGRGPTNIGVWHSYGGYEGDGGPAVDALLDWPMAVAVDNAGTLYIADWENHRVRKVSPDGIITTFAGNGTEFGGANGDGGPAINAVVNRPTSLAIGPDGSVYIGDGERRVRRVTPDGIISTVAGGGDTYLIECMEAECLPTEVALGPVNGLAFGPDENLYINVGSAVLGLGPPLPGFDLSNYLIPSRDGKEVFLFDSSGRHLKTFDGVTGEPVYLFEYDPNGRLYNIIDRHGNRTAIERDALGNPVAIVSPYGQTTALTLNADGHLDAITNPAGDTWQFEYGDGGLLTSVQDPENNKSSYTYDDLGRLIRTEDPAGGHQALERTELENGYEVTRITALGRTSTYRVEALQNGKQQFTNSAGCCGTGLTLAGNDGTSSTTFADGTTKIATLGPDPRFGMQSPVLSALSLQTPSGLAATMTGTRSVSLADADDVSNITSQTDTVTLNGRSYTRHYDAIAKQITITSPAGRQKVVTLDSTGRPVRREVSGLGPVEFTYDSRGRLTDVSLGSGTQTRVYSLNYGADGWIAELTDPLGRITEFAHDPAGRMTAQILPDGRRIQLGYDANGNITSVTPPGRSSHGHGYNAINLPSAYTPPEIGINTATMYGYNEDRQLTQIQRPDGTTVYLNYAAGSGNLESITLPEGSFTYSYDAASGKVIGVSAPDSQEIGYGYDGLLLTTASWSGPVTGTVEFGYDNNFRMASLTINGSRIDYSYDSDSLLTQAGGLALTRNSGNGLVNSSQLINVDDSVSYNAFAESIAYTARHGDTVLYGAVYERDGAGRIITVTETINGTTTAYGYAYDEAGRLASATTDGTVTHTYTYDANGNRLSHTDSSGTIAGIYDAQDRLLTYGDVAYTYTAAGELTGETESDQTTTYDYNGLGSLRSVGLPDGTQIGYVIDGLNRRVGKRINGTLVQGFLYQDWLRPAAELDGSGAIVSRFVYAGRANVPAYMERGGVLYRIITDHRNSVRLVVDAASGTVAQRMDYDVFGQVTNDTNPGFQPFGFAGGLYDADTRLTRFGLRDYDAAVGRWTTRDPIGFAGSNPNLYGYVFNDPVNLIDVTGQMAVGDVIAFVMDTGLGTIDMIATGGTTPLNVAIAGASAAAFGAQAYFDVTGAPCPENRNRKDQWNLIGELAGAAGVGAAAIAALETGAVAGGATALATASAATAALTFGIGVGTAIDTIATAALGDPIGIAFADTSIGIALGNLIYH